MSTTDSNALVESISSIKIGDTQSRTERTTVDTIPLPTARGSFKVDENVIKDTYVLCRDFLGCYQIMIPP